MLLLERKKNKLPGAQCNRCHDTRSGAGSMMCFGGALQGDGVGEENHTDLWVSAERILGLYLTPWCNLCAEFLQYKRTSGTLSLSMYREKYIYPQRTDPSLNPTCKDPIQLFQNKTHGYSGVLARSQKCEQASSSQPCLTGPTVQAQRKLPERGTSCAEGNPVFTLK